MAGKNRAMVDDDDSDATTVTLRPFQLSDVDAFASWSADAAVSRFLSHGPFSSRDEAVSYLSHKIHHHPWYRAICLRGRPVGAVSLAPVDGPGSCRAAIGYRLGSQHWGRGIATTAVRTAVAAVFEEWPELERVEGVADTENLASQRVLEKAGFEREGVLRKYFILKGSSRDVVMYSCLR